MRRTGFVAIGQLKTLKNIIRFAETNEVHGHHDCAESLLFVNINVRPSDWSKRTHLKYCR